jgi:hypothetical protein
VDADDLEQADRGDHRIDSAKTLLGRIVSILPKPPAVVEPGGDGDQSPRTLLMI